MSSGEKTQRAQSLRKTITTTSPHANLKCIRKTAEREENERDRERQGERERAREREREKEPDVSNLLYHHAQSSFNTPHLCFHSAFAVWGCVCVCLCVCVLSGVCVCVCVCLSMCLSVCP